MCTDGNSCLKYGPDTEYIKGFNNTVTDAISRLDYNPEVNPPQSSDHLLGGLCSEWVKNEVAKYHFLIMRLDIVIPRKKHFKAFQPACC